MARINIVNADNKIESNPRRAYFKLKNTGGPRGETGSQGPAGPKGDTGAQGPAGLSASVTVGSTTTLAPGASATVTNSGDTRNAVLNFGIPTGAQGPQGVQGPAGERGPAGQTGAKGDTGAAATVTVANTNTGAPGTNASVENVGDQYNAVLNFTIPRGDKGETGATGPQGPAGQDGKDFTPTVVTALPETGENGVLYMTEKAHTTQTATGNPITATITDGAGKMESFQLDGDTAQQTYTGKNIIGVPDQEATTINGVTYSISNGIITIDGTNTATVFTPKTNLFNFSSYGNVTLSFEILSGTITKVSGDGGVMGLRINDADGTQLRWQQINALSETKNTKDLSESVATNASTTQFYFNASAKFENVKLRVWAEYGDSATDFEPYVGGQPSPNPEYPQAIQTVTGRQVVKVEGKNLFNYLDYTSAILRGGGAGATISNPNGNTLRVTNHIAQHNNYAGIIIDNPSSLLGKNVTISANVDTLSGLTRTKIALFFGTETSVSTQIGVDNTISSTGAHSLTCTVPNSFPSGMNAIMVVLYGNGDRQGTVYGGDGTYVDWSNVQLEIGSTDTSYEPYSSNDYEINLGKNLISANWESGRYNNSTGAKEPYSDNVRIDSPISVQPNTTYICSRNGSGVAMNILEYRADGSFIRATTISSGNSFTTGADAYSITMFRGISGGTEGIQLELGSNITPYAPYFTPIELCKLGTYQDYIYKDGDDWKVHKATIKAQITTDIPWNVGSFPSQKRIYIGTDYIFGESIVPPASNAQKAIALSSHFTLVTLNDIMNQTSDGFGISSWSYMSIRVGSATAVSDILDILRNNTVEACAVLRTPTETTITDQALIAQLEAVRAALLQNGANTITNTATSPNLAGDMEIGYYGYTPSSQYDKWLWLDVGAAGAHYEQI